MDLAHVNTAPDAELVPALLACCDVPAWADAIRQGRPYPSLTQLFERAAEATAQLTAADVDRALAAHPRIGETAHRDGAEATWSRSEQSGVAGDDDTRQALAEGNRAYEERFGRIFLICATGLGATEVLAALERRLANDATTEAVVVAEELGKIAMLRLRRVVRG